MKSFRIDLSDLTANFGIEDDLNEALIDKVQTKLGLDLMADLIQATPVDTGALRNGWQLGGSGRQTTIENMVPYAAKLMEEGHSKQAPSGTLSNIIDKHTRP